MKYPVIYSEKIKTLKMHRSAAKAKLKKIGNVSLGNIHEIEKQLRIIQACNNKIKQLKYEAGLCHKAVDMTTPKA